MQAIRAEPKKSNVSLRKRFAGREPELKEKVNLLGADPVASEEGVSLGAMLNYAKNTLGIENPKIVTRPVITPVEELAYDFVSALFNRFEEQKIEIKRLRDTIAERDELDYKRKMVAKLQFLQLTEALKNDKASIPVQAILKECKE